MPAKHSERSPRSRCQRHSPRLPVATGFCTDHEAGLVSLPAPHFYMPPKVFHEFSGRKPREQWPTEFDLEGVDRDHRVRSQKLNQAQEETMGQSLATNSFGTGASINLKNPTQVA